jgi:serine/threonine protein kinase
VFLGEFVGRLGVTLSANGLDRRVLVKEFTGDLALQLARYELLSVGKLQSDLLSDNKDVQDGEWLRTAVSRSVMSREDDANIGVLLRALKQAPFLGIIGEVNLEELEGEMDANEFYGALGVPPPKPGAVWLVYEYAGLNTISSYAGPAEIKWSRLPPKKGFFGTTQPDPIPAWRDRANYVVKGIMKGSLEALANLHDSGIAHRSIGRSSLILTSMNQDKKEAATVYFTRPSGLVVKLADFGFSGLLQESTSDDYFNARARSVGFSFRKGDNSLVRF